MPVSRISIDVSRTCTICSHPERVEIDKCLVESVPFRIIASRFGTSSTSLQRHKIDHLPMHVARAKEAREIADADDLLSQIKALRNRSISILRRAEDSGDLRTALAGVKEARNCIETLLEVEGQLDRKPTFNLTLSPQWVEIRAVVIGALRDHPEAAVAVAAALQEVHGVSNHATA